MSICVETTSESATRPSRTTAAAVSSQDVSMPRTSTNVPLLEASQNRAHFVRRRALRLQLQVLGVRLLRLGAAVEQRVRRAQREPRLRIALVGLHAFLEQR